MHSQLKIFAFLIALKRERKNSIIFKAPAYKACTKYNLSPQTFKKYLREAIEAGFIEDLGDRYRIISFKKIASHFCKENEIIFRKHLILRSKVTDTKQIVLKLSQDLVYDNVVYLQKKAIETKKRDIELITELLNGTGKNKLYSKSDYKRINILRKSRKISVRGLAKIKDSLSEEIITSCRHLGDKFGVSPKKANKMLSDGGEMFKREIKVEWVDGATFFNFEMAREMNPKAIVHPLPSKDKIKINRGSRLTPPYDSTKSLPEKFELEKNFPQKISPKKIHAYAPTYAGTPPQACMCACVRMYTPMHVCTCVYTCTGTLACTPTCMYARPRINSFSNGKIVLSM